MDLKEKIKNVLVEELMLEQSPEEIDDGAILFSPEGLGLDSVDALQVVVALEKHFGYKIPSSEEGQKILATVQTIADALEAGQKS